MFDGEQRGVEVAWQSLEHRKTKLEGVVKAFLAGVQGYNVVVRTKDSTWMIEVDNSIVSIVNHTFPEAHAGDLQRRVVTQLVNTTYIRLRAMSMGD